MKHFIGGNYLHVKPRWKLQVSLRKMRAKIKTKLPEFSQCLIAFSTATICSSTKNSKEFNRLDLHKPQKHLTRSMSLPRAHCALIKVQQLNLLFKYKICNSKPHWNYRNSEIQERSAWKFSENKQSWLGPSNLPALLPIADNYSIEFDSRT